MKKNGGLYAFNKSDPKLNKGRLLKSERNKRQNKRNKKIYS